MATFWWRGDIYVYGGTGDKVEVPFPAVLAARQAWSANGWPEAEGDLCLAEQAVLDGIPKVYNWVHGRDTRRIGDSNLATCLQHAIERRRGG